MDVESALVVNGVLCKRGTINYGKFNGKCYFVAGAVVY